MGILFQAYRHFHQYMSMGLGFINHQQAHNHALNYSIHELLQYRHKGLDPNKFHQQQNSQNLKHQGFYNLGVFLN